MKQCPINSNNDLDIRIYVNKIENRTAFKIKTGYYLQILTSYIEVWFTDQNSKPLEIENKINITLVTK